MLKGRLMRRNLLKSSFTFLVGMAVFSLFISCQEGSKENHADLDTLSSWMNGSFSSAEQATNDSAYFDVRLQIFPFSRIVAMAIGFM